MKTINQFILKTVGIFSVLYLLFPLLSHADSEPASFDNRSMVLKVPKVDVDSSLWYEGIEIGLNFSTGQFAVQAGNMIADATVNDASAFFSTTTQLLVIPKLVADDNLWFEDVQLQFDFTSAKFTLLNVTAVSAPSDQKEIIDGNCTDTFAKTSCCADPFNAPCNESSQFSLNYGDVSDVWQFTSGASCSSAYPDHEYNYGAGLKEKCKLLDVECGACATKRVKN